MLTYAIGPDEGEARRKRSTAFPAKIASNGLDLEFRFAPKTIGDQFDPGQNEDMPFVSPFRDFDGYLHRPL